MKIEASPAAPRQRGTRSIGVCRALLRNPKTPLRVVLVLLEKLPVSDIRALAKRGHVRVPIQPAARRKVAR